MSIRHYKGFNSDLTHLGWDQTTLALWDFDTIDASFLSPNATGGVGVRFGVLGPNGPSGVSGPEGDSLTAIAITGSSAQIRNGLPGVSGPTGVLKFAVSIGSTPALGQRFTMETWARIANAPLADGMVAPVWTLLDQIPQTQSGQVVSYPHAALYLRVVTQAGAPSVSRVQLYAGIGAGAPTNVVESPALTRLDDGALHHFAVTAAPDGLGAQSLHMYVDGVDVAQGVASYSVPVVEAVLLGVGYYNDLRSVAPQPDVFPAPYQANFEVGDVWIDTTRLSSVDLDPLDISHHYLNAAP